MGKLGLKATSLLLVFGIVVSNLGKIRPENLHGIFVSPVGRINVKMVLFRACFNSLKIS